MRIKKVCKCQKFESITAINWVIIFHSVLNRFVWRFKCWVGYMIHIERLYLWPCNYINLWSPRLNKKSSRSPSQDIGDIRNLHISIRSFIGVIYRKRDIPQICIGTERHSHRNRMNGFTKVGYCPPLNGAVQWKR